MDRRYCIQALLVTATIGLVIIAFYAARKIEQRKNKEYTIRFVAEGLRLYYDTHGQLPDAVTKSESGLPLSSWRFRVVNFISACKSDRAFDVAWNSPANREWADMGSSAFSEVGTPNTFVFAITGKGTAFDSEMMEGQCPDDEQIVIVEVLNSKTHWMSPGDFRIQQICDLLESGSDISPGLSDAFYVGFWDGTVWNLSRQVPCEVIMTFMTKDGAQQHSRDQLLGPYRI
jgi:hypothetical protein